MRNLKAVLATTALWFCSCLTAQAQVVLSESFEVPDTTNFITYGIGSSFVTTDTTWNVLGGSVDIYEAAARPEAVAYDLDQAVDLAGSPGAAIIETSFSTTPGQGYQLSFYYARNNNLGIALGEARVETEGASILLDRTIQHDPQVYSFSQHLYFNDTFIADSSTTKLRFTSLVDGVAGITLDAITISEIDIPTYAVPIPVFGVMAMAAGLVLIVFRRKLGK